LYQKEQEALVRIIREMSAQQVKDYKSKATYFMMGKIVSVAGDNLYNVAIRKGIGGNADEVMVVPYRAASVELDPDVHVVICVPNGDLSMRHISHQANFLQPEGGGGSGAIDHIDGGTF
jgi:hypothetical protein